MIDFGTMELWFATGSQDLYGDQTLKTVGIHANEIAGELTRSKSIPLSVVPKPVLTTPDAITQLSTDANASSKCVGIIAWMHTFSPAKMWLGGLRLLAKPILHLHTQFNHDLPWDSIDMDFMNLNQSAHGDREFGYMATRLGMNRKIVVGHWQEQEVQARIGAWSRAAAAWSDSQRLKVARFGDNMREVAVTEGDKLEAQARFGYSVNGFGVGDLACSVSRVSDAELDRLVAEYDERYTMVEALRSGGGRRASLREAAAIELGMRAFLERGGFHAFTDTFQDLHGLSQLPGIAVQRLMADGYGFGAEGDCGAGACDESDEQRPGRRYLIHGGLHVRLRAAREGARRAHAGGMPLDRGRNAGLRDPSVVHRWKGRPGAAGVHSARRSCSECVNCAGRQPLPHDRQRG
jgi:L-arabinose isomerase